jgi:hypothetical protein
MDLVGVKVFPVRKIFPTESYPNLIEKRIVLTRRGARSRSTSSNAPRPSWRASPLKKKLNLTKDVTHREPSTGRLP